MAINFPQSITAGSVISFRSGGSGTFQRMTTTDGTATLSMDTGSSGTVTPTVSITDNSTDITGANVYASLGSSPWSTTYILSTGVSGGGSGNAPGVKFTNGIQIMNNDVLWNTATLVSGVGS